MISTRWGYSPHNKDLLIGACFLNTQSPISQLCRSVKLNCLCAKIDDSISPRHGINWSSRSWFFIGTYENLTFITTLIILSHFFSNLLLTFDYNFASSLFKHRYMIHNCIDLRFKIGNKVYFYQNRADKMWLKKYRYKVYICCYITEFCGHITFFI